MHSPGLTNAPTTKLLLIYLLTSSIALSILDIKHLACIHVSPHLWPYAQFWRALVWQLAGFANSTEALFAGILVYHCRVVERAWGKRKLVTFILSTLPYTTLLPPILLACILRPLSWGYLNYLPSGPTGVLFALLAQYYASIPHTFRFRIATSSSSSSSSAAGPGASKPPQDPSSSSPTSTTSATATAATANADPGYLTLLLSDKSITYLVAAQLALSQFPATLLPAGVGWCVGLAWRADMLPGVAGAAAAGPGGGGRRVPAWVVGEREVVRRQRSGSGNRYEDMRRRLEGEVVAASGSGSEQQGQGQGQGQVQRRNAAGAGGGFMDRLRGAF